VDLNSVVSIVLFGSVGLMFFARHRAKRSDRKRDAAEAAARKPAGDERPLY
jgi:hypothetical protein